MKILAGQHGGQSSAFLIAQKKRDFSPTGRNGTSATA